MCSASMSAPRTGDACNRQVEALEHRAAAVESVRSSCRHGEDAINADVHRIGVRAREVGVQHLVIAGAVEVRRHGQWDSGGAG